MKKAALIRKYGKGKAWERAGLYYLDRPSHNDAKTAATTITGT